MLRVDLLDGGSGAVAPNVGSFAVAMVTAAMDDVKLDKWGERADRVASEVVTTLTLAEVGAVLTLVASIAARFSETTHDPEEVLQQLGLAYVN